MRAVLTAYLVVVAFLLGMLNEKIHDGARRDEVVARYERALAGWKAMQIRSEQAALDAVRARHAEVAQVDPDLDLGER